MKQLSYILIIIILLLSCLACSTSRGSLFKDTYESDKAKDNFHTNSDDDDDPYYPEDDEYEEEDGLYVTSYPYGAAVYLNNKYYGITPLWIPDLKPGNYMLEISYPGYYPHDEWIYYPDGYMKYSVSLEAITGYLNISVSPADADIYLNDTMISQGVTELRIGTYNLRFRRFGYTDAYKTATIYEKTTASLYIVLEEASFSISDPGISRKVFNPMNPGTLGKTEISFYVTSFGSGTISVTDTAGSEVYFHSFTGFQTWHQYCTWNGRTVNGTVCPDGEYKIKIEAMADNNGEVHSLSSTVNIDSSISISYRSMWNGVTGLMYSCTPEVLPVSGFQISTLFAVHSETYKNQLIFRAPSQLSLRLGTGSKTEVNILAAIILTDAEFIPYTVSAAIKYQVLATKGFLRLQSALYAKAAFHYGTGADTLSNYTGLSLGIPFQVCTGPFSLILNPEVIISPYQVTYTPDYDENPAFSVWGYGRFGLLFDNGSVITGISCAIRTTTIGGPESFGIHFPLLGAYELHIMIPGSNLYVSCIAGTEYESVENYYVMGGLGVGFIY